MAITIDYVILPHLKKEDGTNFIRLRITHKRKSKYIKTNICVEPEDLTRSGNLKNQGKKDLAGDEVKKWRNIASVLPTMATNEMSLDYIVRYIQARISEQECFTLNFAEYGRKIAHTKKDATKKNYLAAISCLCRYFGYEPDISEITVRTMRGFEEFITKERIMTAKERKNKQDVKKKSAKTMNRYLGLIRAVYRSARLEFNDPDLDIMRIPVDIFDYYKIPEVKGIEPRPIPIEWVQMMIDQRKDLRKLERFGVDVFLISFGLMGINIVDLFKCEKAKKGVIHYFRTKTTDKKEDKAEMYVRIEPCVETIINEYRGKSLFVDFAERYATHESTGVAVNNGLRQFIKRNKLQDFTFYSARHTWATLGASKEVGIDFALVTEGLSHSNQSRKMDMVYIRKDWERVWEANVKVLAQLKW